MRKSPVKLSAEEKARIVLAVLVGEIGPGRGGAPSRGERELGGNWRNRFLAAGRQALEDKPPGPAGGAGTEDERRMRMEIEQLKLALAEATVQLRIWRKGAELVEQVPSKTSR